MAILPIAIPPMVFTVDGLPQITESSFSVWTRTYDEAHTYTRTATYDHGGRPTAMTLPLDPDYDDGPAPEIGGTLEYNPRGLPSRVNLTIGSASRAIVDELVYTRDGLVEQVTYGDDLTGTGASRTPTVSFTTYDDRRRPVRMRTNRTPNAHPELTGRPLEDVSSPHDQMLVWDLADNLIAIEDLRDPTEWPDGFRPQSVHVTHDSLYRVAGAEYEYTTDTGARTPTDASSDWRAEMEAGRSNDPMRTAPAPMVSNSPETRVASMTWEHDWLGNMQSWDDDAAVFYERSLGEIVNGADLPSGAASHRSGALYVASNLPATPVTADDGGWVEVRYGEDGNALAVTVHGQCGDPLANGLPADCRSSGSSDPAQAIALSCAYSCAAEQHFTYAWDEVNRIQHARRFGRTGGASWELAVEQRYLYDASNQRTVKTTTFRGLENGAERTALYVYPGDFERRGLQTTFDRTSYEAISGDTETQYGVGGARIVWRTGTRDDGLDRDQRITIALTDLIQSTTAVIDLATGELVETGSYYANGGRETYRSNDSETVTPEPMGFTGKEADEEVGLTYFGHRYLMAHLGRWASPDPLQTHAVGGGEALNGYHYVAGNLLQASDALGLTITPVTWRFDDTDAEAPSGRDGPPTEEYVRELVGELRASVIAEGVARAQRYMDLADRGLMESDQAVALAGRVLLGAYAEANAISFENGHIAVRDVYSSERAAGAPRESLGGFIYERLLVVANDPIHEVMIGPRRPDQITGELRARVERNRGAGYTIPWGLYRRVQTRHGHPDAGVWYLSPQHRGPGFGPGGPRDTPAHELIIHAYRQFAGRESSHGGPAHSEYPTATADTDVDAEAHLLWSMDWGETPPAHTHRGAPASDPAAPIPYEVLGVPTSRRRR